jgi:hypothetical protein
VETRALDAAHDFTDEMRAAVREWLRLRAV